MITDQPAPVPNDSVPIWDLVIQDMKERDNIGRQRYGTPLQTNNGRDALVDAYQEALDLVVYLRQAIEERDRKDVKQAPEPDRYAILQRVIPMFAGLTEEAKLEIGSVFNVKPRPQEPEAEFDVRVFAAAQDGGLLGEFARLTEEANRKVNGG